MAKRPIYFREINQVEVTASDSHSNAWHSSGHSNAARGVCGNEKSESAQRFPSVIVGGVQREVTLNRHSLRSATGYSIDF